MNDHSNHRRRASQPEWPTGDDPDSSGPRRARGGEQEERTGFWSPLWEDDDDDVPPARGRSNGHHGGSNASGGASGTPSKGRASHRLPEDPAGGTRRVEPPAPPRSGPRHGARAAGPAWPTEEPPTPPRPAPGRNGAPHGAPAVPPNVPNGAPHGVPNGVPNGRPPADQPTRVVHPRPGGPTRPGGPPRPVGPPGPGADPDGPTEMLPPLHGRSGPEPELLTHREPDYDEDFHEEPLDEDYYEDEDEDAPLTEDEKRLRRKKIWRRVRRTGYVLTALAIIVPLVGFFVAYQIVDVPSPETVAESQGKVATLLFNNDEKLAEVVPTGGENRRMVKYEEIPEQVKHAVFAAEDAEFMTNPGFDIGGVLRAGFNQLTGGQGGGSTITQQYVKKATGNEEKSISRKALEVVTAYKMNNTYTKEEIITAYLNTIYFGRGAYGIAAAADAYYGKELKDVTASEAALLAGMIQLPSLFDDQAYMNRRWKFVLGQMVDKGWFPPEQAKTEQFPTTLIPLEESRPKALEGPRAHIQRAVFAELHEKYGLTEEEIHREGLVIKTTISPHAQTLAEQAVDKVMKGEPEVNQPALVAVDPKTGAILAYHGGKNGIGTDWAAAPQEPGSSFKPFDLVALLQQGKGLGERYDGTSGRKFAGRDAPVRNASGDSCGKQCTVATAMERSINTVFYDIAMNTVGTKAVLDAARAAGVTSDLNGEAGDDVAPDGNIAIGGGHTRVSTVEMASAYATFAANGMYREPHLVSEVRFADGTSKFTATPQERLAFDSDPNTNQQIARNVTESLIPVLEYSDLECADGRDCAGKTGTHQFGATEDNSKAWMVGYSPQISTAVSMGAHDENNNQLPLKNADGNIVYGSGLPGEIWLEFMNAFHKGTEEAEFIEFEPIGKTPEETAPTQERDDRRDEDESRDDEDKDDPDGPKPTKPTKPTKPSQPSTEPSVPDEPSEPPSTDPEDPDKPGFPPLPGRTDAS